MKKSNIYEGRIEALLEKIDNAESHDEAMKLYDELERLSKVHEIETRKDPMSEKVILAVAPALVGLVGTVAGLICYDKWHKQGLQFEESGVFTSQTHKGLMNKLVPQIKK